MNEEIKELEERFKNGDFDDNEAIDLLIHYSKIIDYLEKENKILRNNYNTALKLLSDSDPKLKEYLENKD